MIIKTFRDAKVPRTRPSCRLQALTGETSAAANDSSQQIAEDHFRLTVYFTSIDKVVSELQSRPLRAMTRRFCAHWEKSYSTVLQATITSKMYQIFTAWIVKCYQVRSQSLKTTTTGTHASEKRSRDGKDNA